MFTKFNVELVSVVTYMPACLYVCLLASMPAYIFGLPSSLVSQSFSVATFTHASWPLHLICFCAYGLPLCQPAFLPAGRLEDCLYASLLAFMPTT